MKPPPLTRRLSATAITRFVSCPKQFLHTDLLRDAPSQEPSPVLVQANAVHHALERFFGLPVDDRDPENLIRALRSVWTHHRKRGSFASADEEAFYGVEAIEMLRRFAATFALDVAPVAREQWLTGKTATGVEIVGKLDRVDECADGLVLVDYKTGKRLMEPADLRHEVAVWVYVSLAEAAYKRPVTRIRFIFLRHGAEADWHLEREDVDALKRRLAERIREIRTAEAFEATPGDYCRFCPLSLNCAERTLVSVDDLVPVEGLPF